MAKKDEKTEPVQAEPPVDAKGKREKDKKGIDKSSLKKEEEVKEEPKEELPEPVVEEPPKKRAVIDKQEAYLEFKDVTGKKIEESILSFRKDVKDKRIMTKDLTEKINHGKRLIDKLKMQIDKKEQERSNEKKQQEMEFDDDEHSNQEIIDEEELVMLKDMKELKREYRDNFNQLKANKSDLKSL
jgi:kinesin family protein 6/9